MSDAANEIGAHVSNAGGVQHAPARAAQLGASVFQVFTKQAARWAEPELTDDAVAAFAAASHDAGIVIRSAHDSYLINLASPDDALRTRSLASFIAELERCERLGIELLVSHPGNATDGDLSSGIDRNAEAITHALETVGGRTMVLLETTAGSGTSIGGSFEQLARIIDRAGASAAARIGVCLDTCHVWSAGYDIVNAYRDVFVQLDDCLGLDRLRMFHLNDSATPFASRRDRHADIGMGSIGDEPFRRIVTDSRFLNVPKVIETPKLPDVLTADLRNLARLRAFRTADPVQGRAGAG
ncbi:MAG TPA: deoxyribonuclease IV [Longimicrobiales bacterium]